MGFPEFEWPSTFHYLQQLMEALPLALSVIALYAIACFGLAAVSAIGITLLGSLAAVLQKLVAFLGRTIGMRNGINGALLGELFVVLGGLLDLGRSSPGRNPDGSVRVRASSLGWATRRSAAKHQNLSPDYDPGTRVSISLEPAGSIRKTAWGIIIVGIAALPAVLLAMSWSIVRSLLQLRIRNMLALILSLWASGALIIVLNEVLSRFAGVQLAWIVATGTLVAALFALLNVDVRGRAELQKSASLACRLELLAAVPHLIRATNSLGRIRVRAGSRLHFFPSEKEMRDLTGRTDLEMRGRSRIFPSGVARVGSVDHLPGPIRFCIKAYALIADSPNELSWSHDGGTLFTTSDMSAPVSELKKTGKEIEARLSSIYDTGLIGKLDLVLDRPAISALDALTRTKFGLVSAKAVLRDGELTSFGHLLGAAREAELQREWAPLRDVDSNSDVLRDACDKLSDELAGALAVEREKFWPITLDLVRLTRLSRTIDSSLRPGPADRLRQFFGK